jgi:hypothetical protein
MTESAESILVQPSVDGSKRLTTPDPDREAAKPEFERAESISEE